MTSAARTGDEIERELGKYHLVAQLARGGMGDVYLAATQGPGGFSKLHTIKELKPELSEDENYVAMFLEEARLAARLIHPNIVQTNEVGSEDNRHFMVMEYLDGRSLHRIIKRLGERLTVGAHLRLIAEAIRGLHHAHELRDFDGEPMDVVHRDVSPLNVFVTFDGQVKVLDFGIAKAVDSSLKTETGVLKGRVAYMAPEQAWGAKVDRRADVYALGVMIWEAAARRRLWPGMADVEVLARVFREGPPSLSSVCPTAPAELDALCARAMAKYAVDRHPTADDLLTELEAHLSHRDDVATPRETGALAADAFVDERARMTAAIEKGLSRLRDGARSGVMPTFEASGGPASDSRVALDESRSFSARRMKTPTGSSRSGAPGSDMATALAASSSPSAFPTAAAPPATRARTVAILAAALAAVAIALPLMLRGGETEKASASAPQAAAVAPASVPSPTVDVIVRVAPDSAQIAIDGFPVPNPFHARYPKDSRVHRVTASADGFETRSESVTFGSDVTIELGLDHHVAASPPPARRGPSPAPLPVAPPPPPRAAGKHVPTAPPLPAVESSAPPAPSQKAEVSPQGGHAPLRPIATTNPYGDQ